MPWQLRRLNWGGAQRAILLHRFPFIIGSSSDCDLREQLSTVSEHHCRIDQCDGFLRIEDAGSRTGTYVNGKRISDPHRLEVNDIIDFGSTWKVTSFRERAACVTGNRGLLH